MPMPIKISRILDYPNERIWGVYLRGDLRAMLVREPYTWKLEFMPPPQEYHPQDVVKRLKHLTLLKGGRYAN